MELKVTASCLSLDQMSCFNTYANDPRQRVSTKQGHGEMSQHEQFLVNRVFYRQPILAGEQRTYKQSVLNYSPVEDKRGLKRPRIMVSQGVIENKGMCGEK